MWRRVIFRLSSSREPCYTFRHMKILSIFFLMLIGPCLGLAQQESFPIDEMAQAGEQWMRDNLDPEILATVQAAADAADAVSQGLQERFENGCDMEIALVEHVSAVIPRVEEPAEAPVDVVSAPSIPEPDQPFVPWSVPRIDSARDVAIQPPEKRPVPRGTESLIARLKPIFIAHQVPAELIWVAEVESSFRPAALSSTGAAGLFQLKPATAVSLGLSLWPTDQRMDPEANARGAAKYLKALRNRFKDWPLALAAYRVGETRVQALLTEHHTRTYDGIAMHLPKDAQTYVPKLNATLLLREGISLASLPLPD